MARPEVPEDKRSLRKQVTVPALLWERVIAASGGKEPSPSEIFQEGCEARCRTATSPVAAGAAFEYFHQALETIKADFEAGNDREAAFCLGYLLFNIELYTDRLPADLLAAADKHRTITP